MSDAARGAVLLPVLRRGGPAPPRGHARRLALQVVHPSVHPQARRAGDVMSADTLISPMPTYGPASEPRRAPRRRWPAGPPGGSRTRRRRRSSGGRSRTFGSRFAVTSSMADAVLIDLVARRRAGHRRGVPRHRLPLRARRWRCATRSPRPTAAGSTSSPCQPEQTVAEQDAEHGRDLFAQQPGPVLLPAQGAAAGPGAGRLRRLGVRPAARRLDRPVAHPGRRLGPAQRHGQGQPAGPLDPGRRRRLHRAARHPRPTRCSSDGFASIGCFPCTRRTGAGEDARGRPLGGHRQDRVRHPPRGAGMSAPSLPAGPRPRRPARRRGRRRAGRRPPYGGAGRGRRRRVLVAPWVCEDLRDLVGPGAVTWVPRDYTGGDLDGAWLVHTATGDPAHRRPGRRGRRGRPGLVRARRRRVAVRGLDARRGPRRRRHGRRDRRRRPAAGDHPARRGGPRAGHRRRCRCAGTGRPRPARVALVGGGPGDPGLITTRGRRLLAEADVVLVDRLAPARAARRARPGGASSSTSARPPGTTRCRRRRSTGCSSSTPRPAAGWCGSRAATRSCSAAAARRRWPAWPPACRSRSCPGSPAPSPCPAAAGIPVTHRGLARQVTIASGHEGLDWASLAALEGTLVLLMGVSALAEAAAAAGRARQAGRRRRPPSSSRASRRSSGPRSGRSTRSPSWPGSATCSRRRSS